MAAALLLTAARCSLPAEGTGPVDPTGGASPLYDDASTGGSSSGGGSSGMFGGSSGGILDGSTQGPRGDAGADARPLPRPDASSPGIPDGATYAPVDAGDPCMALLVCCSYLSAAGAGASSIQQCQGAAQSGSASTCQFYLSTYRMTLICP